MDFAPLVVHLDIDDLCHLYFVNKQWRCWIKHNLRVLASTYALPFVGTFAEMYTLSWYSPAALLRHAEKADDPLLKNYALARHAGFGTAEIDWLEEKQYVFLAFETDYGVLITPEKSCFLLKAFFGGSLYNFKKKGFRDGKATLKDASSTELISLNKESFPGNAYRTGIQTYKQYLFLSKHFKCEKHLRLSLPYVTTVRLFEFFKQKLGHLPQGVLDDLIFDCLHNAVAARYYELALHLVEFYTPANIIYYEEHFREYCFVIGFDLPDPRTGTNHNYVQLVLSQVTCSETVAVKTLNTLGGDVVGAIMRLSHE